MSIDTLLEALRAHIAEQHHETEVATQLDYVYSEALGALLNEDSETERGESMRHDKRGSNGRYVVAHLCDACGRPTGLDYYTDDDVCQGSDDPGFFLCGRQRCATKRDAMSLEERRAMYAEQRAENQR